MANGIFDDDLLELDESPETGQDFEEQATGPEGQPEGSTEDTSEEPEQTEGEPLQGEPLLGKFKSVDDLVKSYQELERKLGSRDEEKEQLRQQLYMLQGYLQALPQMGQQQPTPEQQQAKDEYDELLAEFEQLYPGLTKALIRQQEKVMSERLQQIEQKIGQAVAPVQQFMMQEHFNRQALELAAKYPDFKDYAQDMMQIYQTQPMLAAMPDGMETAYQMAKARHVVAASQTAQTEAGKAAARLPGSSGARTAKPQDAEKAFLEDIFGSGEPTGIFDDL
jgi:hypothetical protein